MYFLEHKLNIFPLKLYLKDSYIILRNFAFQIYEKKVVNLIHNHFLVTKNLNKFIY
jgi:hypothetical protein